MTVLAPSRWHIMPLFAVRDGICECRDGAECRSPGKHPRIRGGVHNATNDEYQLEQWANQWPSTNYGVACGPVSDLLVIDVDQSHDGMQAWASLTADHDAIDTVTSITGGGGLHLYFRHPGEPLKNSVGKIAPGIDVRAANGHVVLPGSTHVKGTYEWQAGRDPESIELAEVPEWLMNLMR